LKIYWVAVVVVSLDQLSKLLIKSFMSLHQIVHVFGSGLQLTYLENPGMAFGIRFFETHPFWGRWFFSFVSVVASVALVWYIHRVRHERTAYRFSLALILGGAVGNLVDRVLFGRVVDFVDVDLPDWIGLQRWYVFNVADAAVVCGMIIMTAYVLFSRHRPSHVEDTVPRAENDRSLELQEPRGTALE
jgi:signal peptidase II